MHLSQSMAPMQTQSMTQSKRLEIKQQLLQNLVASYETLREGDPGSGDGFDIETILRRILAELIGTAADEGTQKSLTSLFTTNIAIEKLKGRFTSLASPTQKKIQTIVLELIYTEHSGMFGYPTRDEVTGEESESGHRKIILVHFLDAYFDEKKFEKKVEEKLKDLRIAKEYNMDTTGAQQEWSEAAHALDIVRSSRPHIDRVANALTFLLCTRKNGERLLFDFAVDSIVLRRLDEFQSGRFFQRAVSTCMRIDGNTEFENFRVPFKNMIAEYTLIGLGIVSPEVFVLMKSESPDPSLLPLEYREEFKKRTGMSIEEAMRHYDLMPEKVFFWQRWNLKKRTATRVTDEMVRNFITDTVRKDAEALLYFFKDAFYAIRGEKKSEYGIIVRQELADVFQDSTFQIELSKLVRTKWLPALNELCTAK